jgi:hypothetical protein
MEEKHNGHDIKQEYRDRGINSKGNECRVRGCGVTGWRV